MNSEEYQRLKQEIGTCEQASDEELEMLLISLNLGLEFDLISQEEYDELYPAFEAKVGVTKINQLSDIE